MKLYIAGDMIHRHRQHDGEYFPKIEIIGGNGLDKVNFKVKSKCNEENIGF